MQAADSKTLADRDDDNRPSPSHRLIIGDNAALLATGEEVMFKEITPRPRVKARAKSHFQLLLRTSHLSDEEVIRRFTRATEILLIGYARYQRHQPQQAAKQGEM